MAGDVLMLNDALRVGDVFVPTLAGVEWQRQEDVSQLNRFVRGIANEDRPIKRVGFNAKTQSSTHPSRTTGAQLEPAD